MQLNNGQAEEYRRRHDAIWPELAGLLKQTGIRDYSIFLDEGTNSLFATLQMEDPALLELLPSHPVMKKWWEYMRDIMQTNPDGSPVSVPLNEIFYLS